MTPEITHFLVLKSLIVRQAHIFDVDVVIILYLSFVIINMEFALLHRTIKSTLLEHIFHKSMKIRILGFGTFERALISFLFPFLNTICAKCSLTLRALLWVHEYLITNRTCEIAIVLLCDYLAREQVLNLHQISRRQLLQFIVFVDILVCSVIRGWIWIDIEVDLIEEHIYGYIIINLNLNFHI